MCGRQRISHRNCWYLFGKSSLHLFYEGLARRHQRQFNDGWLVTQISPSLHSALSSAGTIGIGSVPNRKGDQTRVQSCTVNCCQPKQNLIAVIVGHATNHEPLV